MTIDRRAYYAGLGNRATAGRGLSAPSVALAGGHGSRSWLAAAERQSGGALAGLAPETWLALGESYSKCAHFIHSPLRREWFADLTRQQVAEAAAALTLLDTHAGSTAATPDDVVALLWDCEYDRVHRRSLGLTVPGLNALDARLHGGGALTASTVRTLSELCDRWNGPAFRHRDPLVNFALGFVRAAAVHFTLLRSRPFGAHSAATARVVEIQLLLEIDEISIRQAGQLSIHYSRDRAEYERFAHDESVGIAAFVDYAAAGFRWALRQQMLDSRTFFPQRRTQLYRDNFARSGVTGPAWEPADGQ